MRTLWHRLIYVSVPSTPHAWRLSAVLSRILLCILFGVLLAGLLVAPSQVHAATAVKPSAPPLIVVPQYPQPALPRQPNISAPKVKRCPKVLGLSIKQARNAIERRGLQVGPVKSEQSPRPVGTVIAQHPDPERPAIKNAVCHFVVATAPSVAIPPLAGLTERQARETLAQKQYRGLLTVGHVQVRISDKSPGRVIDQTPAAGTVVRSRTRVALVVAKAPPSVRVPPLAGLTERQARETLAQKQYRGLLTVGHVAVRISDKSPGRVIDQSPAAGTVVRSRTRVTLVVAKAPPSVRVPDLSGLTEREARKTLAQTQYRGLLALGDVDVRISDKPPGRVIGQTPAAGTVVQTRTRVAIVVAKARPSVRVPDLSGLTERGARAKLAEKQYRGLLTVGDVDVRVSDKPAGSVIDQTPAAKTVVQTRTRVAIVVAKARPSVRVPDLSGLTEREARAKLAEKQYRGLLTVGDVDVRVSDKPAGSVIDQTPAAKTVVRSRTSVVLVIAQAVPPVVVPDLSGLTEDQARAQLTDARLVLGGRMRRDSDRTAGTVTAQSPAAGTRVAPGTPVDVVFAKTPAPIAKTSPPIAKYVPLIAGGGAVALFTAGFSWWRRRTQHDAQEAPHADTRLVSMIDPGAQDIEIDAAGPAAPALGLRPCRDRGRQTLVMEDEKDDRDAIA